MTVRMLSEKWPAAVLGIWFFIFFTTLNPMASFTTALILFGLSRRKSAQDVIATTDRNIFPLLGCAVVFAILYLLRPPSLLYWDESAWLGKARLGVAGLSAIKAGVLDPSFTMFQAGYPILLPIGISLFSFGGTTPALLASFHFLLFTLASLYVGLAFGHLKRWGGLAALGLLVVPFSLVHLRIAYADLSLGLMAAALALVLVRNRFGYSALAVILAMSVVSLKDEGVTVLLAAIGSVVVTAIRTRKFHMFYRTLPMVTAGFAPFAIWRIQVFQSGIHNPEHQISFENFQKAGSIVWDGLIRHAVDLQTWGIFWGLVFGALLSLPLTWRRLHEDTRFLTTFVLMFLSGLFCSILLAPREVFEFFTVWGTVTNRLLLQTFPTVLIFLAAFIRDLRAPV